MLLHATTNAKYPSDFKTKLGIMGLNVGTSNIHAFFFVYNKLCSSYLSSIATRDELEEGLNVRIY